MAEAAEEAAAVLRQLAHPSRLMLLCHLTENDATVGDLMMRTGRGQAYVSQQLARLRSDGIVAGEKRGREVHYRLADERIVPLLQALYDAFCRIEPKA